MILYSPGSCLGHSLPFSVLADGSPDRRWAGLYHALGQGPTLPAMGFAEPEAVGRRKGRAPCDQGSAEIEVFEHSLFLFSFACSRSLRSTNSGALFKAVRLQAIATSHPGSACKHRYLYFSAGS